jgi:hypothetical protein
LYAYFDFTFHLSQSRTSLEAYIDLEFHISKSRTSLEVYINLQATARLLCDGKIVVGTTARLLWAAARFVRGEP